MKRALPHAAFALFVALVLLSPMLLTGRTFGVDWTNHVWLMNVQGDAVSSGGPTLFVHAGKLGVFYPHFAFYGGTLYALGGALSVLLGGHAIAAYLLTWIAGFLIAYGGMFWLGYQAGLRGWQAHVAPVILLTSAYFLGAAYARGAWPETIAVSSIPLLLAAAVHLLRAHRVTFWPAVALVFSVVIFTGSHNITLLWGTIAIVALAAAGLATVPRFREVPIKRALTVAGLGAMGAAVNAWFLLPDIVYASHTRATTPGAMGAGLYVDTSDYWDSASNVFSVFRGTPSGPVPFIAGGSPELDTQLPVLVLVWVLVAAFLCRKTPVRRVVAGAAVVLAGFLGFLLLNWPWNHLPQALKLIQFTYRLESYILIALALLVVVLLRGLDQRDDADPRVRSGMQIALVAVLVFGLGQAVVQVWQTKSFPVTADNHVTRTQALTGTHTLPPYWYANDYQDRSRPVVAAASAFRLDPGTVKGDRITVHVPAGGGPVATNIAGGPYVVAVKGARQSGRTAEGYEVLTPTGGELRGSAKSSWPVVLGRVISFMALFALVASALAYGYRARLRRSER